METSVNNDALNKKYQKAVLSLNENLQEGLGLGSFVLKPTGPDQSEFITADKFIPISFGDDGKPLDIGFLTVKRVGENDYFTRFERHYFINGNLTIENKCYHSRILQMSDRYAVWRKCQSGALSIPGLSHIRE